MGKSGMTINTEKLVRNLRRLERDTDTAKLKALRDCCAVFVSTAQKYTPPNMGKKIPGYMYNIPKPVEKASQRDARMKTGIRPIIDMQKMKDDRNVSAMLRKFYAIKVNTGARYFVMFNLKGRGRRKGSRPKSKLTATLAEAQKYARIDYRGLLRAAWGMGARPPFAEAPVVTSLIAKRPDIAKLRSKSSVGIEKSGRGAYAIVLRNQLPTGSDGYERNAVAKGEFNAKKYLIKTLSTTYRQRKQI